ncbi:type II secretion system F family protein [Alloscardovia omnicolens]|nr:type II secretion system F family protein [Alloscardovia omnicolens]MBS6347005.1 type II secretion system F family protein [Alloscardovia omnicolens]MDK6251008.1 type II secretion system F family protein [Alloscardovia omnicolens]MDK6445698.1 type II secretion system F family protein [Alloscardovia omnicolens]
MLLFIHRIHQLVRGSGIDRAHDFSPELVLEMLESCLQQGASLPAALRTVGCVLSNEQGKALQDIAQGLMSAQDWDYVWKPYLTRGYSVLSIMHDVLEPAYKRGVSPSLRIENAIEQLRDNENIAVSYASHELAVGILLPLGLCFLPGFVLLTVIPLLSSWFGLSG